MINLNRPNEDDAAALRQSRIVAFDVNARAEKRKASATPKTHSMCAAMGRAYWAAEDVRMAKAPVVIGVDHAKPGGDETVIGLVGTKPQPDADATPFKVGDRVRATDGDGRYFSEGDVGTVVGVSSRDQDCLVNFDASPTVYALCGDGREHDTAWYVSWPGLELIDCAPAAKPAALPGWRRGPDVPESERKSGLWFARSVGATCYGCVARPHNQRNWSAVCEYRPAPPGVREGDAYSPALYGEEA